MQNLFSLTKEMFKEQKENSKFYLCGLATAIVAILVVTLVFVNGGADAVTNKKETAVSTLQESPEIQGIAELLKQDGNTTKLPSKVSLSDLGQKEMVQLSQNTADILEQETESKTSNVEIENTTEVATEVEKETGTEVSTETITEVPTETVTEAPTEAVTEAVTEVPTEAVTVIPAKPEYAYNLVEFTITDSDYYWLIRIVEAEAGNQDTIGKILVANVIFNRVRSSRFANTVEDVIFQNSGRTYQFSPVKSGKIYNVTPSQHTIDCVGKAMAGEDYSDGALYFTMRTSSNSWFNRELNFLFKHGDHYFYSH